MDGQLTVEVTDLARWAAQLRRAGDDCGDVADHVATYVPDGDFGRILSAITPDYERLVHVVGETVRLDADRLDRASEAVRLAAARYVRADALVARDLGAAPSDVAEPQRDAAPFTPGSANRPTPPTCTVSALPEVSLGWAVDRATSVVVALGGPDLRRELTDLVSGDVAKATRQAGAWEAGGRALAAVASDLELGGRRVSRSWTGIAASAASNHADAWSATLRAQGETMLQVADHLHDAVTMAVDVAQVVVDTVREVVSIVAAGWSYAAIPIYGQAEAIHGVRDAVRLAAEARKVLMVFWDFLLVLKDCLVGAVDCFSSTALPPATALEAA